MGQKIWRRWCHGPRTAIFQNWGGGGGGGAGGGRIQGPGPAAAPWWLIRMLQPCLLPQMHATGQLLTLCCGISTVRPKVIPHQTFFHAFGVLCTQVLMSRLWSRGATVCFSWEWLRGRRGGGGQCVARDHCTFWHCTFWWPSGNAIKPILACGRSKVSKSGPFSD